MSSLPRAARTSPTLLASCPSPAQSPALAPHLRQGRGQSCQGVCEAHLTRPPQRLSLSATALPKSFHSSRKASELPGRLCLRLLSQLPSARNAPPPVSARPTLLLFKSLLRCYFSRTPTGPDSSSGSRLPCPTRVAHPQHSQPTYPPFWGDWLVFFLLLLLQCLPSSNQLYNLPICHVYFLSPYQNVMSKKAEIFVYFGHYYFPSA